MAEEDPRRKKLEETRRLIQEKRQLVITKMNADIQKYIKELSSKPEDAAGTEGKIAACKAKINALLAQTEKERQEAKRPPVPQVTPVEVLLSNVAEDLRTLTPLLKCLNVRPPLTTFHFSNLRASRTSNSLARPNPLPTPSSRPTTPSAPTSSVPCSATSAQRGPPCLARPPRACSTACQSDHC